MRAPSSSRNDAFAPAKVNLFLHVGPPADDGYHPLCSLMVFADVGDTLTAEPSAALGLEVSGEFASGAPAGPDNLVLRATNALGAGDARLRLEKVLPVAAGLGGGSSDAGAALRLLRRIGATSLGDRELEAIAARLGADGPACLWGRPVIAEGYGERLSPAPILPLLYAVLVSARVPVSTPTVYRRLDLDAGFGDIARPPTPGAFADAMAVADWLAGLRNDLEAPACALEPSVGAVLDGLRRRPEVLLARVSGSGGACFALCAGPEEADALAARIARSEPRWWVRACRLGGPWPDPV